jgi:putative ABC transport system ATP-binding protein
MITVKDVKKNYQAGETEVKALRGVSLNIQKGEFMSIAGPSGSGKTTLLNLIGCLDKSDSGKISVDGVTIKNQNKKELALLRRGRIGFIFQSFNLIPVLSAYENVSFVLSLLNLPDMEVKKRTVDILTEVGLGDMMDRRPSQLSGGQQQRVAIARALVKNPLLVLADEPTANLDSKTGEDILKLMKDLNKKHNTTFIFSTHDPMVMDYGDRLVLLHDGEIQSDKKKAGHQQVGSSAMKPKEE